MRICAGLIYRTGLGDNSGKVRLACDKSGEDKRRREQHARSISAPRDIKGTVHFCGW